jgi:hypothetical protein
MASVAPRSLPHDAAALSVGASLRLVAALRQRFQRPVLGQSQHCHGGSTRGAVSDGALLGRCAIPPPTPRPTIPKQCRYIEPSSPPSMARLTDWGSRMSSRGRVRRAGSWAAERAQAAAALRCAALPPPPPQPAQSPQTSGPPAPNCPPRARALGVWSFLKASRGGGAKPPSAPPRAQKPAPRADDPRVRPPNAPGPGNKT